MQASPVIVAIKTRKERASSDRRRQAIAAAIEVLASRGARGLTHREIDRYLQWPVGSTSNYFRRRTDILIAIAASIMEQDLADLASFDPDLAGPAGFSADLLVERTVHLLGKVMMPEQRSRTLARAEILFEGKRNEHVRRSTREQMAMADALFQRIFQQLGCKDPKAAADFFTVVMSSVFVGMSLTNQVPEERQLSLLVRSWVAMGIDQRHLDEDGATIGASPVVVTIPKRRRKP